MAREDGDTERLAARKRDARQLWPLESLAKARQAVEDGASGKRVPGKQSACDAHHLRECSRMPKRGRGATQPNAVGSPRTDLWTSSSVADWDAALARYDEVVERQGVARLAELDRWYRGELPETIASRQPAHVTLTEIVKLAEWKMARGVWRARNLELVRGNPPAMVVDTSIRALALVPHPTAPIAELAQLSGVGPATASAVVAASAPAVYPFFDELVAAQAPGLGKVAWTLGYYARYAQTLRERAARLGGGWTPVMVERALWAHAGGKAAAVAGLPLSR